MERFTIFFIMDRRKNLVSSAKILTSPSMESGRSLMNIRNRIGPSMLPCGIPLTTSAHVDLPPLTITLCFLPVRKLSIQRNNLPRIPYASAFFRRRWCGTLSKALWKSRYTMSILPPSSSMLLQISIISNSCVTQDLPLLKPCLSLLSNDLASRNSISLSLMMDSRSLQMIEVRLTGL